MKWYEYKMEVDDLHASDELKARLLAMQTGAGKTPVQAAAAMAAPARKKNNTVRFPLRRVLKVAACFAAGIVCCSVLVSVNAHSSLLEAGNYAASSAAVYTRESAADGALYSYAGGPSAVSYTLDTANGLSAGGSVLSEGDAAAAEARTDAEDSAKIIYRASLSLESKDYDAARTVLNEALNSAGGYLESSDESTGSDSDRSLSMTLRVPQENYKSFLDSAAQAGNLVSRSEQAEDVTTQYMDVEARLANLEAQRTRLQALEAQADNLTDLLQIESSLSDVQYQIESWQNQLNWYARQVACCTVDVFLYEVREYTPADESFGTRFLAAFGRGWSAFVDGLQGIAVWIAFAWPVLLLAAAVVTGVVIWRRRRHHKA